MNIRITGRNIQIGLIIIMTLFAIPRNIDGQILSASISNFDLLEDGTCQQDQPWTRFSFDLTVLVTSSTDSYSYWLIDGDNRVLSSLKNITGNKVEESNNTTAFYYPSIAPYRIVILNSNPSIFFGEEIDLTDMAYVSHFFNPHDLDLDCPDIICKGLFQFDRTYDSPPQSQSPPIFIKRNLTLNNFILAHNAEFYAGSTMTLNPGYDSGPPGIASSYGIENCEFQLLLYECWDLNQNGEMDISEDINNDGGIDSNDCN